MALRPSFLVPVLSLVALAVASCTPEPLEPEDEPGPALGAWERVLTAPGAEFYDIARVGADEVWVVGHSACAAGDGCGGRTIVAYVSEDGGATWRRTGLGSTREREAYAVHPFGGGRGVLARGAVYRTADGGGTWAETQDLDGRVIRDIAFPRSGPGWAGGSVPVAGGGTTGVLFRSATGETWSVEEGTRSSTTEFFSSVSAPAPNAVFAVGPGGTGPGFNPLLRTLDGGASWERVEIMYAYPVNGPLNLYASAFVSASTGWVGGDMEVVLRTTDAGETWERQWIDAFEAGPSPVIHISARSAREALVVFGTGGTFATADGGATWAQVPYVLPTPGVTRVAYGAEGPAFAISRDGYVLRTNGAD